MKLTKMELKDSFEYEVINDIGVDIAYVVAYPQGSYATYKTLQELYGGPHNKLWDTTWLEEFGDDIFYHPSDGYWTYFLEATIKDFGGAIIEVAGNEDSVTIWIDPLIRDFGDSIEEIDSAHKRFEKAFVKFLDQKVSKQRNKLKGNKENATTKRIVNVYRLYFEGAHRLDEVLRQLVNPPQQVVEDIARSQFFLLMASFEGFLNLIHELYINADIREDSYLVTQIQKDRLFMKFKLAPTRCSCFKSREVFRNSEILKRYNNLVNLRNDFVHANIVPQMKSEKLSDGDYDFWIKDYQVSKNDLPKNTSEIEPHHIRVVFEIVEDMVDLALSEMKPRYRRELSEALQKDQIEVEVDGSDYIILG